MTLDGFRVCCRCCCFLMSSDWSPSSAIHARCLAVLLRQALDTSNLRTDGPVIVLHFALVCGGVGWLHFTDQQRGRLRVGQLHSVFKPRVAWGWPGVGVHHKSNWGSQKCLGTFGLLQQLRYPGEHSLLCGREILQPTAKVISLRQVQPRIEKQLQHLLLRNAGLGRREHGGRSPRVRVHNAQASTSRHQQLCAFDVTALRSIHQRARAADIHSVDDRAGSEQRANTLHVARRGGVQERRPAVRVTLIRRSTCLQQRNHAVGAPSSCSTQQRAVRRSVEPGAV